MRKNEPAIYAGNMSNEELYQWIRDKAEKLTLLRELEADKASLEERLSDVSARIDKVIAQTQLEIFPTTPDPIQIQGSQGN